MSIPNLSPAPKPTPYLTIIESRSPRQKVHTALGHAKNAFSYDHRKTGTLWEWDSSEGQWRLLYTIEGTGRGRKLPWQQ